MALKFVLLLALACTAQARFPKALQDKWGYLDTREWNSNRVVGGSDAATAEAPFQTSLQRDYIIIKSHICGGSLITPNTIVTAAHCTDGQTAGSLINRLGTNRRSTPGIPDIQTQRIVQHANYNPNTIENDISLLILASPVTPSATVAIIPINDTPLTGGEAVKVYGWGLTVGNSQNLPENLQVGDLTVLSNQACNDIWGSVNAIAPGMICTIHDTIQACNGDSGGPLVYNNKLVGIVSWGPSGCPPGQYPAVFTRPEYYQAWIDANKV